MPRTEGLARAGTLWTRAWAVSSWTVPSVHALMTGRYPTRVPWTRVALEEARRFRPLADGSGPWLRNTYVLPLADRTPTLAECARAEGLRTAVLATTPFMLAGAGLIRGFEDVAQDLYLQHNLALHNRIDGPTVGTALSWLDGLPEGARFLLWVHLADPHFPYLALGETAEERYDGELKGTDLAIGGLQDGLRALGLYDETLLLLTGDHGEELGDHGGAYHGATLYEEVLRVPLLLAGPGVAAGRTLTWPVSHTDVATTLADLLGLRCAALRRGAEGGSLAPWLGDRPLPPPDPPRPVFAERVRDGDAVALVLGDDKVIVDHRAATVRSFDLARDPGERSPAASAPADLLRLLSAHGTGRLRR